MDYNTPHLCKGLHGIERECIRITPGGQLSQTLHPRALGSSLMHPYISTDFAEPQLEFNTEPLSGITDILQDLKDIHIYTSERLENELLWPHSMPAELPENEEDIPLAVYGDSSTGKKKTVYRRGIALRYGRRKLTISGIHYNFSFDKSIIDTFLRENHLKNDITQVSSIYFNVIRNLNRKIFFFTYLFGASPVFDKSLMPQGIERFKKHKKHTLYSEFATSLRLSEIGYTSEVQNRLNINLNSLNDYISSLDYALSTCNTDYKRYSADPSGQLNPNFLQIENELYIPVRPKQDIDLTGSLRDALKESGIGYLELRFLDNDPYSPQGIEDSTLRFLHIAILDCFLNQSKPLMKNEEKEIYDNHTRVIWEGRKKGLKIMMDGKEQGFHEAGKRYCEGLLRLAEKMDKDSGSDIYTGSLSGQIAKWDSPESTPSGQFLSNLLDNNKEFMESGLELAEKHAQCYQKSGLTKEALNKLNNEEKRSVALQLELERAENKEISRPLPG